MNDTLDLYRTVVTVLAVMSATMNALLLPSLARHRQVVANIRVWVAYAVAVTFTSSAAAYWRIHDAREGNPFNAGDLTVFLPTGGAFIAGLIAWRTLGRLTGYQKGVPDE